MTVQDAIEQIQQLLRTLEGVRAAPEYPPDITTATPVIVTFAQRGQWVGNTLDDVRGLHHIVIELRVAHRDLSRAVETMMRYVDIIPLTLFRALRAGQLTAIETFEAIDYEIGGDESGEVVTLRARFTVRNAKIVVEL